MDFVAMPPEVTSALIHSGPGAESLLEASGAWQRLGTELEGTVTQYASVVSTLIESWNGPSAIAMVQAVEPYLTWLSTTAQQSQQLAVATQAAAGAFGTVVSTVVMPAQVAANRTRLAQLIATNRFGSNLAAIAQTQSEYEGMWASNSAAMTRYQATSAQATTVSQFTSPPAVANSTGATTQAAATSTAAAATPADPVSNFISSLPDLIGFPNPNAGYWGLFNTYANQFISSGFPINLLSYLAQNTQAQAFQGLGDIGKGLSEGEAALGAAGSDMASAIRAVGSVAQAPTGAMGVGVTVGKITAPPAVVGLMPAGQTPVQLASAATPLSAADSGLGSMLPPLMPPPMSPGSGWRKRKQQKYEDIAFGAEVKGTVINRSPAGG
jgi:PPE-repeat protein